MKQTVTGVFTPNSATESVKFQKVAVALGFAWRKAGAKAIKIADGVSIKLDKEGVMSPVKNAESATLTLANVQAALIEARAGQTVTTRAALLQVFNQTKCREIEDAIKGLLVQNFNLDDNDEFVIPQDLLDRAAQELDEEQRAYFKAAGIVVAEATHANDKYTVTQAFGTDVPASLRKVEVQEVATSAKFGAILVDTEGNVYFANVATEA